ncbi:hypothetical protein BDV24DRAFT_174795 [Aspergillus arachidicola]|uniref:Uncharacterized protein n=1 Tax=Aspergillus arachidicola TaxID=656916 RepID=A0A2G7FRL8_9EURO|nr:hypothetical protein BDV24DRAFT_174795 [Aspergillus arachidicola]PIG82441.1 hypothetical protein AARAC_004853 [Aspergillus arachidicola]
MRFQCLIFATLSLFLLFGSSHAFVGPSCMAMKDSLGNKPDGILKKFEAEVCKAGCKPRIADYDKWAKKNVVYPVIELAMKKMGAESHTGTIKKLAADVVTVIKGRCAKDIGKGHLCQDPDTLSKFGNCLKSNLMPIVMGKIGDLMPLVTEPMCKKEKAYLESPDLWEKIIPGYLKKYASTCSKI